MLAVFIFIWEKLLADTDVHSIFCSMSGIVYICSKIYIYCDFSRSIVLQQPGRCI